MSFENKRPMRDEPRINRRIRVPEVRLIDDEGNQLGVVNTREAIQKAEDAGLDLVEIQPTARPPVCKIMDYGKHKYEINKKKNEQKKKQVVVHIKEIKLRPSTDEHDFQTKVRHIKRFLEEGDKVKVTVRFRGREMAHLNLGQLQMKKLEEEIKGVGEVEGMPKLEGKQMFMMVVPCKKKTPSQPQQKPATPEVETK